jgi:hypothetical protein
MSADSNRSLGEIHQGERMPIVLMLLLAFVLFLAGLFRPFTQVTKLWLFDSDVSVYSGLITLYQENGAVPVRHPAHLHGGVSVRENQCVARVVAEAGLEDSADGAGL